MWAQITNISTVASLVGFSLSSAFADAYHSHLLSAAGLISISYLTWKGYATLNSVLHTKYTNGYKPIATFMRYSTSDGKNGVYECFRHIQIKEPLTKSIPYRFYWTGSKPPKISSTLQRIGDVKPHNGGSGSEVELHFNDAKYYNSSEIVHTQMHVDDSDEKSEPYVCLKITDPMQLIHLRSELLHAKPQNFSQKAYVERRLITANSAAPFELVATVAMDPTTKAFEHIITTPEPGYNYRLRWDRIKVSKAQKRGRATP